MKFHRGFQYLAIPVVSLYDHIKYRYHIIGREKIPDGGCVVCANHTQWADPVLVASALGNKHSLAAMGKKELFQIKGLAPLITALGCFPVDRDGADVNAIRYSLKAVKDGRKLLIFPEGTTHHAEGDATKLGAARIALKTKAPILPVYISENKSFQSEVFVVFGDPFVPEPTRTREGYERLASDIMNRIYGLKEIIPNG